MGLFSHQAANRAIDAFGDGVVNAIRHIYPMGSVSAAPLFSDEDLTVMRANGMRADAEGYFDLCYLQDGEYRVEIVDPRGRLLYAEDNIVVGSKSAHRVFDTVADLVADGILNYTGGPRQLKVRVGEVIRVEGANSTYRILGQGDPGAHLTTDGGVALREAGVRYSSEARFIDAVAGGETFAEGATVTAGSAFFVFEDDGNTDLPGLTGWARVQQDVDFGDIKTKSDLISVSQQVNLDVLPGLVAGSNTYDSIAAGLAATSDGEVFFVPAGPGLQVYRNDTGAETFLGWHGDVLFDSLAALLASSATLTQDTVARTRTEGFVYRVAASGASDHHVTTAGGVKLYVEPLDGGWLAAEQFGPTGTANDTDVLAAMASYGRAAGALKWRAKSGVIYTCERPWIFGSIPIVEIDGNGAYWQNPRGTLGTVSPTYGLNEGMFFPTVFESIDVTSSTLIRTFDYGELIDTADEDTTTIEMDSGADMGGYSVGMRCLLYGYCVQTSGFPLSTRYFEWVEITAIAGTTITVKDKLRFTYDKDWPLISTDTSHDYRGPPRLLPLSRTNFEEIKKLSIRDLTFLADPNWLEGDGGTVNRNGRLSVGGYDTCILQNVRSEGGLYILSGRDCESRQCVFAGAAELDKMVGSYRDSGSEMHSISQGTGTLNATFNDTIFHEGISQITALSSLALNNVSVLGEPAGSQIIAPTFGCRRISVNGGVFRTKTGLSGVFTGAAFSQDFDTVSATVISASLADMRSNIQFMRQMWIGQVLWAADGTPLFEVERVYENSTDVYFQVRTINTGFTSGDTLYVPSMGEITIGQPYTLSPLQGSTKLPTVQGSTSYGYYGRIRDGKPEVLSSALKPLIDASGFAAALRGIIRPTRITVDVIRAYSGTTGTTNLSFRSATSGATQFMSINVQETGKRMLDLTGGVGAKTGDTLTALPDILTRVYFNSGATSWDYANEEEAAIWTMHIEGPYMADTF